jgi:hypothetical protein
MHGEPSPPSATPSGPVGGEVVYVSAPKPVCVKGKSLHLERHKPLSIEFCQAMAQYSLHPAATFSARVQSIRSQLAPPREFC